MTFHTFGAVGVWGGRGGAAIIAVSLVDGALTSSLVASKSLLSSAIVQSILVTCFVALAVGEAGSWYWGLNSYIRTSSWSSGSGEWELVRDCWDGYRVLGV